jgi:Abortive infection C-terminus
MADLTLSEKWKFEKLLGMGSGYVLDFSNRTFEEFIHESTGREIYDERYAYGSGSKANRLRDFWNDESNPVVGKLMGDLLDRGAEIDAFAGREKLLQECRKIVARLVQGSPVSDPDALTALTDDRDFQVVAKAARDSIERNELQAGLDRLHTFVIKYVRLLCEQRGVSVSRDKPLHSIFGEYVKSLKSDSLVESLMTARILKSSISTLEAFNDVRNNQSLAHDNPILNYDEALLIYNHVASSVRFLRSLEARARARDRQQQCQQPTDEPPF